MNVRELLTLTTLPLLLSGCTSFGFFDTNDVEPIEIKTQAVERTRLNLPDPQPLKMRPMEWVVVTPDNIEEVWTQLKESNTDLVLFGLTDEGYESLAINMSAIRNKMNEQRIIILKYKDYYEPPKDTPTE